MNEQERQKRRHKRLQKQKDKREQRSRAGRSPREVAQDPLRGRHWPADACWVTQAWDVPGARVDVLVSRSDDAGNTVAALFTLDRSGPGVVAAQVLGGLTSDAVTAHAGRMGEASGHALVETTAAIAVGLVRDAAAKGTGPKPEGWAAAELLVTGLDAAEPTVPFGPKPAEEARPGLLGRLAGWFGR